MPFLLDAYHASGPDPEARQDAVLRRFEELAELGEVDPGTSELLRPAAELVQVDHLPSMAANETRTRNYYVLAQVMRLTRPKQGKPFKLTQYPEGQLQALDDNLESVGDVISLGQYDCMVWLRQVEHVSHLL